VTPLPKGSISLGFWKKLSETKKPFFALAPMADVTDQAFRRIIEKYSRHGEGGGGPDVFWTEFVSADGLMSPGREALIVDLKFSEAEHPIIAQIFGTNLQKLEDTARLCVEMGFDGIDINFGCPEKNIVKSGGGSGAIRNPEYSVEVIRAVQRGAAGKIPVSVKTRLGFNRDEVETWIPTLLQTGLAALTIHFRTRKEMSLVPARWERMERIKELRDTISPDTILIGNGDVKTLEEGRILARKYGAEGVMIGRGIFGNPWLFDEHKKEITIQEKLKVMLEHTKLYTELLPMKNFNIMKKHYKAYVHGFDGAKELRVKLMESSSYEEIEKITKHFLETLVK
jgi:nifR3 family TIM-barrel protein